LEEQEEPLTRSADPPLSGLVNAESGTVDPSIFTDWAIYKLELERIFDKCWLFVAHDSEIPQPGDFVTRRMGSERVIISRGTDGAVHVMLNACRHRLRPVCMEDAGRTAQFTCPYHGWTYTAAGELIGVPFFDAYEGRLDKRVNGLYHAPRVDSHHGLIFASWDEHAGPLLEYLGSLAWVFDLLFGRTGSMEVVGPPMRWTVESNWKLGAGNFAGDGHHVAVTHGFIGALGMKNARGRSVSYVVPGEHGHVANLGGWPPDGNVGPFLALPKAIWPEMERRLSPEQLELMRALRVIAGNMFPNMSFLETASPGGREWGGPEDLDAMSFLTIRQWQPLRPDLMEIWTWQLMDASAPDWWKAASRQCYLREFGAGGIFEQDDTANWSSITRTLRAPTASRLDLRYDMGLGNDQLVEWPGPGLVYSKPAVGEISERLFYKHWQERIQDG
jgi:PAH dioxygenase large subunit